MGPSLIKIWSGIGGEAEQPERADYGNASTDRLKGSAFEAQERANKSSILPLLAVKCLGFFSVSMAWGFVQNTKQQLWTNIKKMHAIHEKKLLNMK